MDKREYYSRPGVAARYDRWRFGSAAGRFVDEREQQTIRALLAPLDAEARILDLPVGTGRVAAGLIAAGHRHVFGADASAAMLAQARARCAIPLCRLDARRLPLAADSFDAIVCARFLFHFALDDVTALLAELARVLRPGGVLVCDGLRWSPRAALGPLQARLGGSVYCHSEAALLGAAAAAGLACTGAQSILLLPSQLYAFVPERLLPVLARAEGRVPSLLCSKTFWRLRKSGGA